MAKFANDTLVQVAGFDGKILAQELVYNQKDFWNLTWNSVIGKTVTAVNLTGVEISAQIIRRQLSDVVDGRHGLEFQISDYPTPSSPVDLTIVNRVDTEGKFTMVIDDDVWGVLASDPELNINATDPVGFSGRIKLSFPSVGTTPAYDESIFLLFLIRSDGVVN